MANSNGTGNKLACLWPTTWDHVHFCTTAATANRHFYLQATTACKLSIKSKIYGPERHHTHCNHKILLLSNRIYSTHCSHMDAVNCTVPFEQVESARCLGTELPPQAGLVSSSVHTQWQQTHSTTWLKWNLPTQSKNGKTQACTGWGSPKFMWPTDCHTTGIRANG